jgi:hypothetical protein
MANEGIIDAFTAAALKKPESILSDHFLAEVRNLKRNPSFPKGNLPRIMRVSISANASLQ